MRMYGTDRNHGDVCAFESAGVCGDLGVETLSESVDLDVEVVLGPEVEPEPWGGAEVAGQNCRRA
jgi:hypothetical protein